MKMRLTCRCLYLSCNESTTGSIFFVKNEMEQESNSSN